MSETATEPKRGNANSGLMIGLGALAVLLIAALYFASTSERPLARSQLGFDGLLRLLRAQDIPAQSATGASSEPGTFGLRILPLFDTDLRNTFYAPSEKDAYLKTGTEIDLWASTVQQKLMNIPTLLIAQKWQRGVRHSGYAHDSLLLPLADVQRPLSQINAPPGLVLIRPEAKFFEFQARLPGEGAFRPKLYAPQLFNRSLPEACSSLMGGSFGHLLVECTYEYDGGKEKVIFLSDPDLMNNHGLHLGENARLASALIAARTGAKPAVLDMTRYTFTREWARAYEAREWSDLLRFFGYPFSMLWLGVGALTLLAVWRSSRRIGPADRVFVDTMRASKSVSIEAEAHLMGVADRRGHVFEAYIQARMRWLNQQLHGPHIPGEDQLQRLVKLIRTKNPDVARSFGQAATTALMQHTTASPQAQVAMAERFEQETEKVLHEFGRTPSGG